MKKKCARCHLNKPLDDFSRNRSEPGGFSHTCRSCRSDYRRGNPRDLAYAKKYIAKNYAKVRAAERLRRTGFTKEYWDEMWSAQEGCCASCGVELRVGPPPSRTNGDIACADHDHRTNTPRGILCWNCNSSHFEDDPARLRLHAEYLESYAQ